MGSGWYSRMIWVFGVICRLFLALMLPALWLLTFNSFKTRHYLCNCVGFGNVNVLHSHLLNLIKMWKGCPLRCDNSLTWGGGE